MRVSLPAKVCSFIRVSKKAIVKMVKLGHGRKERVEKSTQTLLPCANLTILWMSRAKKGKTPTLLDKVSNVAIPRKRKTKGPDEQTKWSRRLLAHRAVIARDTTKWA